MNFKIGVDGGGTKTDFILTEEDGTIVAHQQDTGCNPSLIGAAAVDTLINKNVQALLAESRKLHPAATISHTLLCMAGSRPFWIEYAATLSNCGLVQAFDDSIPVLELATDGKTGLVLHAGTGSFVAARDPSDGTHYAGGLGWRFGDPASAYDLGRHAIGRAILEMQGWAKPSAIGEAIRNVTNLDNADDVTRHFYADDMPHITVANLAPQITAMAATGDKVAREIVGNSAQKLAQLASDVIAKIIPQTFDEKIPVGLSGAILQTETAQQAIISTLGNRCTLSPITKAPIEGVRHILSRLRS